MQVPGLAVGGVAQSNLSNDAITRDLEVMHDKGFNGAMIFDFLYFLVSGSGIVKLQK